MWERRQRLHKDPDKATGVPGMSGQWKKQLLTHLCAISHTHAGRPEEAPSPALLVTCPRGGWCMWPGQTHQGQRRNRVIKISRGQIIPLSSWECRTPLPFTFRSPAGTRRLNPPVDGAAKETRSKQGKQLSLSFSPRLHLH